MLIFDRCIRNVDPRADRKRDHMSTATIKLFLVHGDAKRLRTAELSNWNGKAIAGPRSEFEEVIQRDEADQSGVYFLTGMDPETGRNAVYVGEAESIRGRVRSHLAKDFWNHIVFVVGNEALTKAHVRFLEGRLIEQARSIGRAEVMNGQGSGSKLPESDVADMEVFLEKIHQLLPVLGVDAFVPMKARSGSGKKRDELTCTIKGLVAKGRLTPNGLVVLVGSQAVLHERPSAKKFTWSMDLRNKLKEEGALVERKEHLEFLRDVEFSSPSAAAAVIHGGQTNGLVAWKNADGKSLKDLEEGK